MTSDLPWGLGIVNDISYLYIGQRTFPVLFEVSEAVSRICWGQIWEMFGTSKLFLAHNVLYCMCILYYTDSLGIYSTQNVLLCLLLVDCHCDSVWSRGNIFWLEDRHPLSLGALIPIWDCGMWPIRQELRWCTRAWVQVQLHKLRHNNSNKLPGTLAISINRWRLQTKPKDFPGIPTKIYQYKIWIFQLNCPSQLIKRQSSGINFQTHCWKIPSRRSTSEKFPDLVTSLGRSQII